MPARGSDLCRDRHQAQSPARSSALRDLKSRGVRSTPKPLVTELAKSKAKLHPNQQIFFLLTALQEPVPPGLLKTSIDGQRGPATLQSTEVQIR